MYNGNLCPGCNSGLLHVSSRDAMESQEASLTRAAIQRFEARLEGSCDLISLYLGKKITSFPVPEAEASIGAVEVPGGKIPLHQTITCHWLSVLVG